MGLPSLPGNGAETVLNISRFRPPFCVPLLAPPPPMTTARTPRRAAKTCGDSSVQGPVRFTPSRTPRWFWGKTARSEAFPLGR